MRVKFLFFIVLLQSCLSLNVANKKVASNSQSSQNEIQYVNSDETKEKGYPFSDATVVNGIIYLSGAIGTLPDGSVVSGGIVAETRQTMMNIKNRLEKMGGSMDDIFKCTCMLADIKDWPLMSQEYKKFFNPDKLPARSAFAGSGLALGAKLEIECMAIKRK
jgi:enamine deaminase RidA (YjgF/YER057c/UK114 family)|tara:strand:+ start:699 stop:1184 length:486 start_codon:yes stop_codon:yes gene_type:complete